jgi:hypothetical protein
VRWFEPLQRPLRKCKNGRWFILVESEFPAAVEAVGASSIDKRADPEGVHVSWKVCSVDVEEISFSLEQDT